MLEGVPNVHLKVPTKKSFGSWIDLGTGDVRLNKPIRVEVPSNAPDAEFVTPEEAAEALYIVATTMWDMLLSAVREKAQSLIEAEQEIQSGRARTSL
jgi:hypothetical protein